ncbi:hypothetical protein KPL74_21850 [Bacillus sp. NP157]|nr:hypothetical protein KPL74_21850 [Bacillus sp. NP157]
MKTPTLLFALGMATCATSFPTLALQVPWEPGIYPAVPVDGPLQPVDRHGGPRDTSARPLHVWIFVHDSAGETDAAKFMNWYVDWWIKDMETTVAPGVPITVSLRAHVPGLTDIDYQRGKEDDRLREFRNAGGAYARAEGGRADAMNKFVLFVGAPLANWPSGTYGTAAPTLDTAIASNHGHRFVFAHEVGHLLGATHEASEQRAFCTTNMGRMEFAKLGCYVYTKANDRKIRDYLQRAR